MARQSGVPQVYSTQSNTRGKCLSVSAKSFLISAAVFGLVLLAFRHAASSWLDTSWPIGVVFIHRVALASIGIALALVVFHLPLSKWALPTLLLMAWAMFCAVAKVEVDYRLPALEIGLAASFLMISLGGIGAMARFIRAIPALICMFSLVSALLILSYELQSGGVIDRLGFRLGLDLAASGVGTPSDGLLVNPNEIALPIALSSVALFSQDLAASGWAIRWGRLFLVAVSVVMLVLTQSRGMLIAFALGVFAASLFGAWRRACHLCILLAIGGLVACAAFRVDPLSFDLLNRFGSQDTTLATFGDRSEVWESSIMRCVHEPIFGQSRVSVDAREIQLSPHNALLGSAELAGAVGALLLTWLYLQPLVFSARARLVLTGTLVGLIVSSMSMDTLPRPVFWIIYASCLVEISHYRPRQGLRTSGPPSFPGLVGSFK
jgi:hypothetical protein